MSLRDKLLGNKPPLTPEPSAPAESVNRASELKGNVGKPLSMQDRIRQANKLAKERPANWNLVTTTGDICLLLDDSSSMDYADNDSVAKINRLNEGIQLFADEIDFGTTKIIAIPMNEGSKELTTRSDVDNYKVDATGGTPMDAVLAKFGHEESQQAILISDGEANNDDRAIAEAAKLAEYRKRVDCIHIGTSHGGEKTLKKIAELTGGMFFKFQDVKSFAASLRQLAPKRRGALANKSAEEIKMLTGASEVIK